MKAHTKPTLGDPKLLSENLRKVWERKSKEYNLNQKEAADLLGWSRGALCQYLNGHTKINVEALIKLANFFDVDPAELDPNIVHFLPNTWKIPVKYATSNAKLKRSNRKPTTPGVVTNPTDSTDKAIKHVTFDAQGALKQKVVGIEIDAPISWGVGKNKNTITSGTILCVEKNTSTSASDQDLWLVQLKNEDTFKVMDTTQLPRLKDMEKSWIIISFLMQKLS